MRHASQTSSHKIDPVVQVTVRVACPTYLISTIDSCAILKLIDGQYRQIHRAADDEDARRKITLLVDKQGTNISEARLDRTSMPTSAHLAAGAPESHVRLIGGAQKVVFGQADPSDLHAAMRALPLTDMNPVISFPFLGESV